jgi:hypothetical protein
MIRLISQLLISRMEQNIVMHQLSIMDLPECCEGRDRILLHSLVLMLYQLAAHGSKKSKTGYADRYS